LIVDDHPLFRQGLVSVVEDNPHYMVIGQAASIAEAMDLLEAEEPDMMLIDISLGEESGLELVKNVKALKPHIMMLVISMYDEVIYASTSLKAGARGYLMKQEAAKTLMGAIEEILKGKIYLSDAMRERMIDTMVAQQSDTPLDPIDTLSAREKEVFRLIGNGYGVSEIAEMLNLSFKTINVYRDNIRRKIAVSDAGELRKYAIKWTKSREL
jgi:DNA-binding NarL/FixJ family response regulator